jgi:hypothetical protein
MAIAILKRTHPQHQRYEKSAALQHVMEGSHQSVHIDH